jgi:hypothetical protein
VPFFALIMFLKAIYETVRIFRKKNHAANPDPLCVSCLHAHVQYAANARRAISCAYGGAVRPMKLDVLYCTDYQTRNVSARCRVVGFVPEIIPAE